MGPKYISRLLIHYGPFTPLKLSGYGFTRYPPGSGLSMERKEFGFYASHSWAEKHFAHVFHETGEYEREKLIWHCKQSPAHCLNCIEKVKKWIYFCNTVHQRWNELPKNPDKMKKTQQDCSMAPWLMVQIIHHRTAGMIIFQAGFTPAAFRHTANCWATLEARTGLKSC